MGSRSAHREEQYSMTGGIQIAHFAWAVILFAGSLFFAGLIFLMAREARSYTITRVRIDGAPGRIVLLADLHITGRNRDYIAGVCTQVNALDPNVVLIAGDFILGDRKDVDNLNILSLIRAPCFAVLGNHDYHAGADIPASRHKLAETKEATFSRTGYDVSVFQNGTTDDALADAVTAGLAQSGITVLRNACIPIDIGGRSVLLVGLDDCEAGRTRPPSHCPAGYTIYLLHEPECIADWDYDLLLSGHTHGGQIVLPLIGKPADWLGYCTFSGMRQAGEKTVYVTRGVGTYPYFGLLELRLNCPPEIVLINGDGEEEHPF